MKLAMSLAAPLAVLGTLLMFASREASAGGEAPPQAHAVGFDLNTFSSAFKGDIDLGDTRGSDFHWYLARGYGWPATQASSLSFDESGALVIAGPGHTANYAIGSAGGTPTKGTIQWFGTAFGGGGYFEAEIKFDPKDVVYSSGKGFPSWWMASLEHMVLSPDDQWLGQAAGYSHFSEIDILEYNQSKIIPSKSYAASIHDWFGVYNKTCPIQFCDIANYAGKSRYENNKITLDKVDDYRSFHKYGVLWVPATKSAKGYVKYYFDGKETGDRVDWDLYDSQPPPAGSAPWTFGITDKQHFVLILGTGENKPMTIQSVNVWQASDQANLHQ